MPFATDAEEVVAEYARHALRTDVHHIAHAFDTGPGGQAKVPDDTPQGTS
ncbi:hypothetical protein [Streptomyces roseochromogenus]|uniref:Uncharacterized protein n=1 Tax=Streptomyces roseochromogenus subsp. oscitans DS 12.976 TaxID=1352936 RepID=V6K8T4_STRRC|nr:hypothetical protein [Streptomyces roseochromogenus]EST28458.1 hypothetical protein M878_22555 [Streptomyces roseochromogenus subsp. oscitans DS 12.976]